MKLFASADVIARAFVTACQILGADPLTIYEPGVPFGAHGLPIIRARHLAWHAIVAVLPEIDRAALARGLGYAAPGAVSNILKTPQAKWWREEWLDEVVGAILERFAPSLAAEQAILSAEPVAAPSPVARAEPKLLRRATQPPRFAPPSLPMGEPAPGRSALDKRRAGVVEEDFDDGRARRKAVSLPKLSFMEKGF